MLAWDCRVHCSIPKSWPVFLRSVPGKGKRGVWRETGEQERENQQSTEMWREPSARGLDVGPRVHLVPAEILDFWGCTHSEHQYILVGPYPKARHVAYARHLHEDVESEQEI